MAGTDATFRGLLLATAEITRPDVTLDAEGGPRTPTYHPTGASARVRITPARAGSEDGLLGRMEEVTHVIYAMPADIRIGDRLVTRPVTTALSEDVEAGETELPVACTDGIRDGGRVRVGGDELTVMSVTAGAVVVRPGVAIACEEGEAVSVVERYEVLGVKDAAGMGHHLRLTATDV
ncbi:MAG: hypothetical protein ACOX9R_19920 [Armatimonadota bacterium]|jgi:hypothetical protein